MLDDFAKTMFLLNAPLMILRVHNFTPRPIIRTTSDPVHEWNLSAEVIWGLSLPVCAEVFFKADMYSTPIDSINLRRLQGY